MGPSLNGSAKLSPYGSSNQQIKGWSHSGKKGGELLNPNKSLIVTDMAVKPKDQRVMTIARNVQ